MQVYARELTGLMLRAAWQTVLLADTGLDGELAAEIEAAGPQVVRA